MELNTSLWLIKSRLEYVVDAILHCPTPFEKEGLIPQLQGVLPGVAVSCQLSLRAEGNGLTQGHTSQKQPASSDWINLGVQRPGPLIATWTRFMGFRRPILGLHCYSTSRSTQSTFFCSLLQIATPRAFPYKFPTYNLRTSHPNNPAWNSSSQEKHPGGGSIWLSIGTKNETGKQRVHICDSFQGST